MKALLVREIVKIVQGELIQGSDASADYGCCLLLRKDG